MERVTLTGQAAVLYVAALHRAGGHVDHAAIRRDAVAATRAGLARLRRFAFGLRLRVLAAVPLRRPPGARAAHGRPLGRVRGRLGARAGPAPVRLGGRPGGR